MLYGAEVAVCYEINTKHISTVWTEYQFFSFNPLNTKLNPICHLLALLAAHFILHISRIRVKPVGPRNQ